MMDMHVFVIQVIKENTVNKLFMIALKTLAMKMDIVLIMRKVGKEEKCKYSYHKKNDFYVVLFYSKIYF